MNDVNDPLLTITIPRLPSAVFGGNSRQHWSMRYKESLVVYDEVLALVKEAGYNGGMLIQPRLQQHLNQIIDLKQESHLIFL